MSKLAIKLFKPFIRGFKFAVYDSDKAWFRLPINGKFNSEIPLLRNKVKASHSFIDHIPVGYYIPYEINNDAVILYLHGGGFSVCNYKMYAHLIRAIANETHYRIAAIDYRLAPKHPFPAGLEDCRTAYLHLRAQYPNCRIYVGGDSAGGGLTISLAHLLKQNGEQLPDKLFVFSPWADLRIVSESFQSKAIADPLIDKQSAIKWAERYLQGTSVENVLASPVLGEFSDFPPSFIHVGDDEVLLGDSALLEERMKSASVQVEFKKWEGMTHVFQVFYPLLDEAVDSINDLKEFLLR
jgi:acetyl esterase/lipase